MSESKLELTLEIENLVEFKTALNEFRPMLKDMLYRSFQRTANKEEQFLKSTAGFQDRTGHLRKSLYVLATFNPLGLELGALAKYAIYVAEGHGTWRGNWWRTYIRKMTPRVAQSVSDALKRVVRKFNRSVR